MVPTSPIALFTHPDGVAVFLVMQFIVLPLAGLRGGMPSPPQLWNLLAAHLFCVGLPIGLVTRRYMGTNERARATR